MLRECERLCRSKTSITVLIVAEAFQFTAQTALLDVTSKTLSISIFSSASKMLLFFIPEPEMLTKM